MWHTSYVSEGSTQNRVILLCFSFVELNCCTVSFRVFDSVRPFYSDDCAVALSGSVFETCTGRNFSTPFHSTIKMGQSHDFV